MNAYMNEVGKRVWVEIFQKLAKNWWANCWCESGNGKNTKLFIAEILQNNRVDIVQLRHSKEEQTQNSIQNKELKTKFEDVPLFFFDSFSQRRLNCECWLH